MNDVPQCGCETKTGCINADCVDVAESLIAAGLKPAILNLASRRKPGGGYDRGMSAQEETLCRLSTLSQSLYQYMAPDGGFTPAGDAIQLNKIRTICRLALKNGRDSIVLGAFGCGVNKLPCDAVADQFRRVFAEPEFAGKFRALVFAIREGGGSTRRPVEESGKFAPFYATFGKWQGV